MSPSGAFGEPTAYATVDIFVCAKYDPTATLETASKDPATKDLCATTDDPKKCLNFLGNTPDADPAFIMKGDLKTLKTLIEEGAALTSKAETPNVKKSYETVGDAEEACEDCVMYKKKMDHKTDKKNKKDKDDDKKDKDKTKCPKNKVTKITSKLSAAVSSFGFCDEALDGASGGANTWVLKDMNSAMIEATNMLLEVSKQLDK
ncbi:hypothetical protein LINPERPRIM_LOCUS19140 [Linum perenne]